MVCLQERSLTSLRVGVQSVLKNTCITDARVSNMKFLVSQPAQYVLIKNSYHYHGLCGRWTQAGGSLDIAHRPLGTAVHPVGTADAILVRAATPRVGVPTIVAARGIRRARLGLIAPVAALLHYEHSAARLHYLHRLCGLGFHHSEGHHLLVDTREKGQLLFRCLLEEGVDLQIALFICSNLYTMKRTSHPRYHG